MGLRNYAIIYQQHDSKEDKVYIIDAENRVEALDCLFRDMDDAVFVSIYLNCNDVLEYYNVR